MGGHGIQEIFEVTKRWKIATSVTLISIAVTMFVNCETYFYNYHQNKLPWHDFKRHKMQGLLPPYQTNYSRETFKQNNVKIDWESFRDDVQ